MTDIDLRHLGENAELWRRFKEEGDAEAREQLILQYLELVRHAAGQMAMGMPAEIHASDLETYGVFGLIDALDKFNIERGIKFETYAVTRIRGSILDGVRNMDWVPASVRRKNRDIEEAHQHLRANLGRPATDEEVADYLGITVDRLHDYLHQISQSALVYLDESRSSDDPLGVDTLLDSVPDQEVEDPFEATSWQVQRESLARAIEELTDQERLVVTLYYYEGLTLSEIARTMDLSPSRISQVHSKAVTKLRGMLQQEEYLFETGW